MGSSKKKQVIGYEYGATMHLGLGLAADEIYRIEIGGKLAWAGSINQNGVIFINQPNLFGGKKGEGGVVGTVEMLFGGNDQVQSGLLTRYLGTSIPAFRGTATAVFNGILCAMNWYPKTWDICYRRIKSGWKNNAPWYPEKIIIFLAEGQIQAMNPAHILYESYVSDTWGAGEAESRMDDTAYKKAADILYDEGFGLCFEWKATDELKSLRNLVCEHIGAILGTDPATGKNTIRLIRDDYHINDLPVFDEDHGLLDVKFEATNNTEVPSQVIVKYTDAIAFEERPAYANNPAIAQGQRGRNTETIEFPALPTGELATRVAYRELKTKTSGIKRCTLKLDRRAYDIVNGQPFRIKTKYRINNIDMVVRADRRQEKFLTDGTITLNVLQDVFSLPKLAVNPVPPAPIPESPKPPVVINQSLLLEAPYQELAGLLDPANLALVDNMASFIFTLAKSPANNCYSYDLLTRVKGAKNFIEVNDTGTWCPTAALLNDISFLDKHIKIEGAKLLDTVETGSTALINGEIVRIDGIDFDNNQLSIARGCIDTVPAKHKAGSIIWFYDGSETIDTTEYNLNTTVETKLLSNTFTERLAFESAPTQTIVIQGRQGRPYPAGNLKINGMAYPESVTDKQLTVTWSHRDRLLQADQIIDTTIGDMGMEDGVTYGLKLYVNNRLFNTVEKLINNQHTFDLSSIKPTIPDDCLMQFNTVTEDDAGNQWVVNGNPKIIEDTQAIAGKCLELAGDSYLTTNNADIYHFGLNAFTIECWCKPDPNKTEFMNVILSSKSSAGHIFSFGMGSKYYPGMYIDFTQPDGSRIASGMGGHSKDLYDGNFHHIAIVRDDKGRLNWFFDGKKAQWTNTYNWSTVDIKSDLECNLGCFTDNDFFYFGGLDQLRITKQALYLEEFTPSREPYVFNDGHLAQLRIQLTTKRDNLNSWQQHQHTFLLKEVY